MKFINFLEEKIFFYALSDYFYIHSLGDAVFREYSIILHSYNDTFINRIGYVVFIFCLPVRAAKI